MDSIKVINRNNEIVDLDFNRIKNRINKLIDMEPKLRISSDIVAIKTISYLSELINTSDIDNISANIAANMITHHIDYDYLASRIMISNLHKNTKDCYYETVKTINENMDNILMDKLIKFAEVNIDFIKETIDYKKDYTFKYFGILVLIKSYLLKKDDNVFERPQHMYMRVAIGLHLDQIDTDGSTSEDVLEDIKKMYNLISEGYYTHATPTLFNSGTNLSALSSCFLLEAEDSVDGIYNTLRKCAFISKFSGGIGVHVSQIRAKGSKIRTTGGVSEGLVKMLKVYDTMTNHMSQGGGKRKGSIAIYFELWHADVMELLDCILPMSAGDESLLCRNLFFAAWIDDLFFERLEKAWTDRSNDYYWSLFCPNISKNLVNLYGDDFKQLYEKYESKKMYIKQINILDIWYKILKVLEESGRLYMMSKDNVNQKCNQNNLGTIKSSNLCVVGETKILTEDGYKDIKSLNKQAINIWNGKCFSPAFVKFTGEKQITKLYFSDGTELKCSDNHKFFTKNMYGRVHIKECKDLKIGDKLCKYKLPIIDGKNIDNAYTNGLIYGMDSFKKTIESEKILILTLNKKDYTDIKNSFLEDVFSSSYDEQYIIRLPISVVYDKIPYNGSIDSKKKWIKGFVNNSFKIYGDGNIYVHKSYQKLLDLKYLLSTLGMITTINSNHLVIESKQFVYINSDEQYYLYENYNDIVVKSIIKTNIVEDMYCCNEPERNSCVLNSIETHNCSEITIYTDKNNIGVCNLASVCLNKFVVIDGDEVYYDYKKLYDVVYQMTVNLNKVIENNNYPVAEGKHADQNNRPIGIGVQGLADVFMMFKTPFTSELAKKLNRMIFEMMYYAAMSASCDLAKKYGHYKTYKGCMIDKGIFQYDLWDDVELSGQCDWEGLKKEVAQYGIYNSYLIALMPTASTASIAGNSENFEPITSNFYERAVLSGKFQIVNKFLVNDLIKLNLWNDNMKQMIIAYNGSIQQITQIPEEIRDVYKTAYEYNRKDLIDMDADRAAFVCQSMSSNKFIDNFDDTKITRMYIYAWKKGLKTLSYYIRSKPAANPVKFTIDNNILKQVKKNDYDDLDEDESDCLSCGA